jgi:hypothetical protein
VKDITVPKTVYSGHAWMHSPDELGFQFTIRRIGNRTTIMIKRGPVIGTCVLGPQDGQALEDVLKQILYYDEQATTGEPDSHSSVAGR